MPSESSRAQSLSSRADEWYDSGRILATPLISVPDRATRPDYYAVVTDPTSLDIVQSRAESDYYRDPQEFDKDLLHVFTTAKIFIRPSTPGTYWGDLLQLQVRLARSLRFSESSTDGFDDVAIVSAAYSSRARFDAAEFRRRRSFAIFEYGHSRFTNGVNELSR